MATPRIFVSHSHVDDAFGQRLITDLRRDLGSEDAVWYDASGGLYGGDAWWRKIVAEITERDVFIVLLSPDAVASKWVEDEIDLAWQQKNSPTGKLIIPILYRDCHVRPDLTTRQIIAFTVMSEYAKAYSELLSALGMRLRSTPTPTSPEFPGLPYGTSRIIWCMEPDRVFALRFAGALWECGDRPTTRVYGDTDESEELVLARALTNAHAAQPDRCPGGVVLLSYGALLVPGFGELLAALGQDVRTRILGS